MSLQEALREGARLLSRADAIVITAGAGMSVDSGLPDFRGPMGFWNAYPAYQQLHLTFADIANPLAFEENPRLAWGFYGHRLNLYRKTEPHAGYYILKRLGRSVRHGTFVFTSNVDGAFQKAGFDPDQIVEHHGSIHHVQCSKSCSGEIFTADDIDVSVDPTSFMAWGPLPRCEKCGELLRPNVLMFGDAFWNYSRSGRQHDRLEAWLKRVGSKAERPVIVEIGAGTTIPSVRARSESLASSLQAPLIRINPTEAAGPPGTVSISATGMEALVELEIIAAM